MRKHPLFFAILFASATACVAQGWLIHTTRQRGQRAAALLEAKRQERDRLARQSPALSEENSRALASDVAAAEKRLAELDACLGTEAWLPPAPSQPVDAYFEMASFIEKMRTTAAREQIALRADERFGFSSYANEGPERELLASVHRQRVVTQHLVAALFEAHPRTLLAVGRERPLTVAQRAAGRAASIAADVRSARAAEISSDFFEPDARLRLTAPGRCEGELYRVQFTGETPVLRAFLNALTASPLPLFVRAVEVEPADPNRESNSAPPMATAAAPVPLVTQNVSKFAVVVECLELASIAPSPSR